MPTRFQRPTVAENILSLIILSVLVSIGISLIILQNHFEPARWQARSSGQTTTEKSEATITIDGVQAMTPLEVYAPATLSDKIDGKAELYLSAGFIQMESHRLSLTGHPELWMERFVYNMGNYTNAFAVFSRQRRSQSQPLDLTTDAYQSANGIFLVQGPYYIEIIGSDPSDELVTKMKAWAKAFVDANPTTTTGRLNERELFPKENLIADSVTLTPVNAFGFDRFDNVFTAQYRWGDKTATAFISRRSTPGEAAELVKAYTEFLLTYGGEPREAVQVSFSVKTIEILDAYEIVFNHGPFLAGIHEIEDPAKAAQLAEQLFNNLDEK